MEHLENWLDSILENPLPEETAAIAFNLYEDEDNNWSMEMVGTGCFDPEDSDWACDEVFDTRDDCLSWKIEASWEDILKEAVGKIKNYLETGAYSEKLKSFEGVGVGFVDGDLIIVYQRDPV